MFFVSLLLTIFTAFPSVNTDPFIVSEDAYRANNIGVALLEQYKHKEAVEQFEKALRLKPDLALAKVNLAIALYNAQDLKRAKEAAAAALVDVPNSPRVHYVLGLIWRVENNQEEALAAFRKVLLLDANDVGANVNVGQILSQRREYDEAVKHFETAYKVEPYNTTAVYNLATALQRKGDRERAAGLLKIFQSLRESGAGTSIGINYLEQGRYAEAVASTGSEAELVDKTEPKVYFQNMNVGLLGSRSNRPVKLFDKVAALLDFDGDGDLDIAQTVPAKLFRNDKGKFVDVTAASGDFARAGNLFCYSIVAGDYDNDGRVDLFASWNGRFALYSNLGKGRFSDVTLKSKIPNLKAVASASAFVDVDHDGDLDIVLNALEKISNFLFRNNGDGTFTDVSAAAGVDQQIIARTIIPTDYDNRRDVDLVFVSQKELFLLRNLRNGSFKDVAAETGLEIEGDLTCGTVGDFNKDNFVDFFFGRRDRPGVFAISDGQGKFVIKQAPGNTADATSALFVDFDNDGLLDLVVNTMKGLSLARNVGDGWSEIPGSVFKTSFDLSTSKQILSADLDSDGDMDLLVYAKNGALQFLRNEGGNSNNSETLRLKGRASNRTAIGSKIDMRAGSLAQKLETYSASPAAAPSQVHFGLGKRTKPDAVRVVWPSGIVQSEIEFPGAVASGKGVINFEELDRKPSSCPYLFAWNGERFEFITDFLGGGEMGNWAGPGVYHKPDSDEFVRISADKLKARNGRYQLRITNELEEVLFLDHVKLVAVEHPAGAEVYPNEGLGIPTSGKRIMHTTEAPKLPVSAVEQDGTSVLEKVKSLDRVFYDDFESLPIRGYAAAHELTLTLDNKKGFSGRTLLLLTGWTDYAFSSDNLAASQSGKSLFMPYLQVKNKRGEWETVIKSIGISVGRPQTVVVDLTGKFLTDSREVRIVTNFKTYWDKIEVDTSTDRNSDLKTVELLPVQAELRERGFSAEVITNGMIAADYQTVLNDGRWKYFDGRFTRLGDVRPLIERIDDTFVISKTGDELVLSFKELPPPPAGRSYTFLLYADGYSKEMDINSGSPYSVFPLPFKGMTKYPYGANERFPMTEEKLRIYDEYNTRIVRGALSQVDAILLGQP